MKPQDFQSFVAIVIKESILVSDAAGRFSRFAGKAGITHVAINASAGERVAGVFHIQNVNAYQSRLKTWMRPSTASRRGTCRTTSAGTA